MKRLIWLASYPKSGNTWVRSVLAHYDADAAPEWAQWGGWHAASLGGVYASFGVEPSDLTASELTALRPEYYRRVSHAARGGLVVKVHDRSCRVASGGDLFPTDVTRAAVYLVRSPLDVTVSWASHANVSIDDAVGFLCSPDAHLAGGPGRPRRQFPQHLGSWADHVASWVSEDRFPVTVVRYEDLLTAPLVSFARIVQATGRSLDLERLGRAVDGNAFDGLKAREKAHGFRERPRTSHAFFRSGRSGDWREALSSAQVDRLIRSLGTAMQPLGYLSR